MARGNTVIQDSTETEVNRLCKGIVLDLEIATVESRLAALIHDACNDGTCGEIIIAPSRDVIFVIHPFFAG